MDGNNYTVLQEQVKILTEQMLKMMDSMQTMNQSAPALTNGAGDRDFRPVLYNQVNDQEIKQNNFQISGQRSSSKFDSETET